MTNKPMTMNEWLTPGAAALPFFALVLAALAGVALGALFFGGLWWTTRRGGVSSQPALWFAASLLLRMGITLPAFYLVGGGRWQRLLACLFGFLVARVAVTWLTRPARQGKFAAVPQDARHAP